MLVNTALIDYGTLQVLSNANMSIFNIIEYSQTLLLKTQVYFHFTTEGSLVNKRDLLALYFSGTYCHKTSTSPLAVNSSRTNYLYYVRAGIIVLCPNPKTKQIKATKNNLSLKYFYWYFTKVFWAIVQCKKYIREAYLILSVCCKH